MFHPHGSRRTWAYSPAMTCCLCRIYFHLPGGDGQWFPESPGKQCLYAKQSSTWVWVDSVPGVPLTHATLGPLCLLAGSPSCMVSSHPGSGPDIALPHGGHCRACMRLTFPPVSCWHAPNPQAYQLGTHCQGALYLGFFPGCLPSDQLGCHLPVPPDLCAFAQSSMHMAESHCVCAELFTDHIGRAGIQLGP